MPEQKHFPPAGESMIDHRTLNCPCGPQRKVIHKRSARGRAHQGYQIQRVEWRHQPLTTSRPVFDNPDSVTHWTCPKESDGQTHHIENGKCVYCKVSVTELADLQARLLLLRKAS